MIRRANLCDLDRIEEIYNEIHTEIEAGRAQIGWTRGIYPDRELAENSIRLREMYVMEEDGVIVASGRINRSDAAVLAAMNIADQYYREQAASENLRRPIGSVLRRS